MLHGEPSTIGNLAIERNPSVCSLIEGLKEAATVLASKVTTRMNNFKLDKPLSFFVL